MMTSITSIAIYMITIIIVALIIVPNVSHSETATWRNIVATNNRNNAPRNTRQRYSRDWKWNFDNTDSNSYYKKPRNSNSATTNQNETIVTNKNEHRKFGDKFSTTPKSTTSNSPTTIIFNRVSLISSNPTPTTISTNKFTPQTSSSSSSATQTATFTSTTPRLASKKVATTQFSTTKKFVPKVSIASTTASSSTSSSISTVSVAAADADSNAAATTKSQMFYHQKLNDKSKVKIAVNLTQNLVPLPAGASAALVKPTKYHYYPHNQHIYLLPECAIQQVCNAVYVRLNYTQPLCACPSRYRDPCSASLNSDDLHTTELITDPNGRRALTLVKTCEPTAEMRECRAPRDWSLLALQNIRTGKSHYLVICRCSENSILEGPISHDQPTYASVPGIRVYGMMCVQMNGFNHNRESRPLRVRRHIRNRNYLQMPQIPLDKLKKIISTVIWD